MFIRITLFCFLFISQISIGQIDNFSLTVVPTNETCLGNGSLQFSVSGTQVGASISYSIYLLPNTSTPIATTTSNSVTNLNSGTYRVIATQSLNGASGSKQQDVVIQNNIIALSYQLTVTNEYCIDDGTVTVNVNTGTATQYEIFAGPMIRPLQNSNVFQNLTAGQYSIRVFNSCGEGIVQTFTILDIETGFTLLNFKNKLETCSSSIFKFDINRIGNGIIKYPFQIQITIYPSGQSPIIYNQTITNGGIFSHTVSQLISVPPNTNFNYSVTVTNGCGEVQTATGILPFNTYEGSFEYVISSCDFYTILWKDVQSVTLTNSTAQLTISMPFVLPPSGTPGSFMLTNAPPGQYYFTVVDICNISRNIFFTLPPIVTDPTILFEYMNCTDFKIKVLGVETAQLISTTTNFPFPLPYTLPIDPTTNNPYLEFNQIGTFTFLVDSPCLNEPEQQSITIPPNQGAMQLTLSTQCNGTIKGEKQLQSVILVEAPATFPSSLPFDYSYLIYGNGYIQISGLPSGTYTFVLTDTCGITKTESITITSTVTNSTTIIKNCGSFDVNLNYQTVPIINYSYYLQKWNPITNKWVHPITNVYNSIYSSISAIELINNQINYNFGVFGQFRIVGYNSVCETIILEFDFYEAPKIIDVYGFLCANNTYDVLVDAVGTNPLIYRIIEKNGSPFVVQNGNQSVFFGLAPGQYKFQVEDACGNIINSEFQIPTPFSFGLTASSFCTNQSGFLSVPNIPGLTYKWWKNNATSTILSTTNILIFNNFNDVTAAGTYYVNVTYNHPNSCINLTFEYQILPNSNSPNAGLDTVKSYCNKPGIINLFDVLEGNFNAGGVWQEITNSNALIGTNWNTTLAAFGTYQFKYHVNGNCASFDESLLTIHLYETPETPVVPEIPTVCEGQDIQLVASTVANATYEWTGPNNFTSNVQSPIIQVVNQNNSGIYTVTTKKNNCISEPVNVTLKIAANPDFELVYSCVNDNPTLTAIPVNNSFQVDKVSYNWTNASGLIGTSNPITLENQNAGTFTLVVTTEMNCATSKSSIINNLKCSIQKGISPNGDLDNDFFDLTNLDVENLKIFNRYGVEVYTLDNYKNEWKGQDYKERLLPSATYYYVIKFRDGTAKTGWIYLSHY